MALKIIGAGFGRTGTLSLKLALEQLGFNPCYHMMEVFAHEGFVDYWAAAAQGKPVNWDEVFKGYQATVDWPGATYWKELAEKYPDAKVLLSVREPSGWYKSVMNTIYGPDNRARFENAPADHPQRLMVDRIFETTFDGKILDEDYAIGVFNRHTADVKATIPADRLLVYEVGSGWEPICEFFGLPVPDTDYPHSNSTEDFRNNFPAGRKPPRKD